MAKVSKVATDKSRALLRDSAEKRRKTRIHITLDEEVSAVMEELALNKSKFINRVLRTLLFGEEVGKMLIEFWWSRGPDLNRRPADLQGIKTLNELWERYKGEFEEWLSISRKVSEKTRKDYLKALNYFFVRYTIKTGPDIKKFLDREGNKRNIANGLRVFLTFLAERDYIDYDIAMIIKKRFIKARQVGVKRIYITDRELKEAYEEVKKRGFKKQLLFELLVFTGLRLSHVVELMNTYEPEKLYIVNDKITRYPLMIVDRGNKKAYWAYMPLELAKKLTRMKVNYKSAQDWPQHGKVSAATIRKWFTTFLARQGVSAEIIDFIQGRAPRTVLERHYLNLTVLADEAYSRVVDELKKVLEG